METRHKEAKQGNFIYSGGKTGEIGRIDYQKNVLEHQFKFVMSGQALKLEKRTTRNQQQQK